MKSIIAAVAALAAMSAAIATSAEAGHRHHRGHVVVQVSPGCCAGYHGYRGHAYAPRLYSSYAGYGYYDRPAYRAPVEVYRAPVVEEEVYVTRRTYSYSTYTRANRGIFVDRGADYYADEPAYADAYATDAYYAAGGDCQVKRKWRHGRLIEKVRCND